MTMTDLEQRPEHPPDRREPPAQSPDPWSATWSWITRFIGAAIILKQAFFDSDDRQWLLLVAMALMVGELGAKALLRFFLRQVGE